MASETYSQIYYSNNKEHIKKYLSEKTVCECGSVVARVNLSRHRKTNLHQNRLRDVNYFQNIHNNN